MLYSWSGLALLCVSGADAFLSRVLPATTHTQTREMCTGPVAVVPFDKVSLSLLYMPPYSDLINVHEFTQIVPSEVSFIVVTCVFWTHLASCFPAACLLLGFVFAMVVWSHGYICDTIFL
jgi:hypothetical protein